MSPGKRRKRFECPFARFIEVLVPAALPLAAAAPGLLSTAPKAERQAARKARCEDQGGKDCSTRAGYVSDLQIENGASGDGGYKGGFFSRLSAAIHSDCGLVGGVVPGPCHGQRRHGFFSSYAPGPSFHSPENHDLTPRFSLDLSRPSGPQGIVGGGKWKKRHGCLWRQQRRLVGL